LAELGCYTDRLSHSLPELQKTETEKRFGGAAKFLLNCLGRIA